MNCCLYVVTWDGTELVVKPTLNEQQGRFCFL